MTEQTRTLRVRANGLEFEVLEQGTGDRLALLLHGFPETALCWRHQMPLLARLGYRVWAPNQRGYGTSSRPGRVADYDIRHLVEDAAGLAAASGAKRTLLVGHDWGGVVAWWAAAERALELEALAILNMPHPDRYRAALKRPSQALKAWYVGAFQLPLLPDRLLAARGGRMVERAVLGTCRRPGAFPADVLADYRRNAASPGGATAMLAWYRAATRGRLLARAAALPRIGVPTLVVWGEADAALDAAGLDGTERHVADLTVRRLPGVSHWVQEEAPEAVNAELAGFLASRGLVTAPAPGAPG